MVQQMLSISASLHQTPASRFGPSETPGLNGTQSAEESEDNKMGVNSFSHQEPHQLQDEKYCEIERGWGRCMA